MSRMTQSPVLVANLAVCQLNFLTNSSQALVCKDEEPDSNDGVLPSARPNDRLADHWLGPAHEKLTPAPLSLAWLSVTLDHGRRYT